MSSGIERWIAVLERGHNRPGIPNVIVGTCPLPETPNPPTVQRWLATGAAHIAFHGHAVVYDGGKSKMTIAEWEVEHRHLRSERSGIEEH